MEANENSIMSTVNFHGGYNLRYLTAYRFTTVLFPTKVANTGIVFAKFRYYY